VNNAHRQTASGPHKVCPLGIHPKGVTKLAINANQARDRAEAIFKKKEERLREGEKAMAEYEAARLATREKTTRLRALRLARDIARKTPVLPAQKQSA
jgi:hypothetical protein